MNYEGTLHIYGQAAWHDEAYVCGTREGLEQLRRAIDVALQRSKKSGRGASECGSFTSDGEGFKINVVVANEDQAGRLKSPYTDDIARDTSTEFGPWDILKDIQGAKDPKAERGR